MTEFDVFEVAEAVIQEQQELSQRYKIWDKCENSVYLEAFTDGVQALEDAIKQWLIDHEER